MKKTTLTLVMMATVAGAYAETDILLNNPDNHAFFGIRASLDIPCPKTNVGDAVGITVPTKYKNGVGVELKGVYNIPLVSNLYIEPGFGLYYDTYGDDSMIVNMTDKADASVRNFGLRVPVMIGYHFDFTHATNLAVFTGPMFDLGLTSDYHYSYTIDGQKQSDSFSLYKSGLMERENRADCKWMFGVGLTVNRSYYIGVSGGVGIVNINKHDPSLHENLVQLSLGYNF